METKPKLLLITSAIFSIACTMNFESNAQTQNYILKWSGSPQNTATPIFEDAVNLRIGIGTLFPEQNLSVYNALNIDQSGANAGSLTNGLSFGSSSGEGIGSRRTSGTNQFGLDFYTSFTNRMTIANGGNVGIGTITPGNLLTVTGGNIDINTADKSYMINNTPVLWHNNLPTSIYVGVGAGNIQSYS